jgi:hypothetical protein
VGGNINNIYKKFKKVGGNIPAWSQKEGIESTIEEPSNPKLAFPGLPSIIVSATNVAYLFYNSIRFDAISRKGEE